MNNKYTHMMSCVSKGFATAFSRISSLVLIGLFSSLVSNAQLIFISEDFSTGTGTTPPSGWTQNKIAGAVVGDLWNFSNPKPRAFASPIAGNFAIFDSDFMGTGANENVALESPSVSTLFKQAVWLQWDQYFNGTVNANDSITVEVFDGTIWNKVYSYKGTAAITNSQNIDVSAVAANKANVKVRFRFVGNYSYWWIVDNVVLYQGAPVSNFSINNDNQCIPGNSFVFTNTTTNTFGTMSYSWDFGDGSPFSTAVNPPPKTYAAPGTYVVKLKATTSYNGASNTSQSNVYVIAAPTATYTTAPGANTCDQVNVTYTTQTGQTNYVWTVPGVLNTDYQIVSGGTGTSSNTVTLKWLTGGSKTVTVSYKTLSISNCQGFAASNTTLVSLRPTPSFTVTPSAPVCTGFDVVYTTQSGQQSYVWGIPGVLNTDYTITSGGTSVDNTVTLKWITSGSKTVTIGYTSAAPASCINLVNGSSTVTANASPVVTFSPAPITPICQNVDELYRTQSNVTNSNFIWNVPGTLGVDYTISSGAINSGSNQFTLKWLTGGNKTVTVNYTNNATGCTSPTNGSATVLVDIPNITFTTAPGANVCDKTDVTYTTQAGQTAYIWSVPGILNTDYTITSGGTGPTSNTVTLKWLTTGSKTVTVSYTNSTGCTSTAASNTTNVNASPTVTFTTQPGAATCSSTDVTYTTQAAMTNYVWNVPGVLNTDYTITSGSLLSTSNTVTLKWLTSGSKTITVNYSTVAGCPGLTVASNTTTVNLRPIPSFTTTPAATVCSGVDVTYTTQAGQTSYVWSVPGVLNTDYSITSGGTGSGSNTVTLKWLTAGSKTVTVNYTNASSCTGLAAASNTTTVNLTPVVTFTSSPGATLCSSTSTTYTTQAGQTNYVWSVPGVLATDYNIISGGTGSTSNTVTLQWLTSGSKTVTVNYTTTSGCPGLTVASSTTTVNLRPTVTFTASAAAISCTGVDVVYTTQTGQTSYAWGVPGSAGVDYTISSGGIGSGSNTVTLKWLTTGSKTVTINYTDVNGCTALAATSNTTTVNTTPNVAPLSNQTVCATTNTAAVNFLSVPAGGTFTWTNNNTAIGLAASGSGNIPSFVATNSTTSPIFGTINVLTTVNGCTSPPGANFSITVNNFISAQPANATTCINNNASFTVGTVGAVIYQWQENRGSAWLNITNGSPINGGTYSGATTATLTLSNLLTMFNGFQYRCIVTGSCVVTSNAATLTVNAQPAVTSHPVQLPLLCPGAVATYSVTATGFNLTYQWQEWSGSAWNNILPGGIYQNPTTPTLTLNGVVSGMNQWQYRCVVSGGCAPSPATSNTISLLVATPLALVSSPSNVTKCVGSNHTFVANVTGTAPSPQWQLSTDGGVTWTPLTNTGVYSGTTTVNLNITGMTAAMNNYQYRCVVTGPCNSVTTNVAILGVNSPASIAVNPPTTAVVCEGGSVTLNVTAGGAPTFTYQWQVNNGSGFVNINPTLYYYANSNSTTAALTITNVPFLLNNAQYRCVIFSNTCPGAVTSTNTVLTVNQLPAISSNPSDKTTCVGSNTIFTVVATGTGLSYQWQENNGTGFVNLSNVAPYSGVTTNTFTITGTPLPLNGFQYRCVVSGTCTPPVTSLAANLTINTLPAIFAQPLGVNLCPGQDTSFKITASGTGITYQWQVNQGTGFVNLVDNTQYSGSLTNKLSVKGVSVPMNNYQYRCVVTGACPPQAISNNAVLLVKNPVIILAQTKKDSACEGESIVMNVITYGSALKYQWQVKRSSSSLYVDLVNVPPYYGVTTDNMSITKVADTMNGFLFRCKVFETTLCNTTVYSDSIPMIVNLVPPTVGSGSAINEGLPATFTVTGASGTTKYQWQEDKQNGAGFSNLVDGIDYNGVNTSTLSIISVKASQDKNEYRCVLDSFCATTVATKPAVLRVNSAAGIGKTSYADNSIIVYPNPVSGNELFIKTSKQLTGSVHVRIVDVVGKQVYSKDATLSNGQTSVDVSGFVSGSYNMIITDNANHISSTVQFTRLQ